MKIPSVVATYILAGLTVAIGILGIVLNYLQTTTVWTVPSIIALVIAVLTFLLNYLTNNTVQKIYTQLKGVKK